MEFNFAPVPHDEAISRIKNMPAVSREVYDALLPEIRAAVFTVKGVALAKDREAIRDLIAEKFEGTTTYEKQKAKVIAVLKANDFKDKAAERRAEFLLRHWTGIAYSAARYRLAMTNPEAFPWWQYLSMGDTRVRATHGVLNLKIIRYDSPFWETHLPPWEPMCRCSWRELSDFDLEEIQREDADKPVEQRRFLEGPILKKLENDSSLMGSVNLVTYKNGVPEKSVWTPMMPHDLRTPAQKGQGWQGWNPRNIVPGKAELEKMLKPESVKEVMEWAETKKVDGATVAEWIEGKPQAERAKNKEGRSRLRETGGANAGKEPGRRDAPAEEPAGSAPETAPPAAPELPPPPPRKSPVSQCVRRVADVIAVPVRSALRNMDTVHDDGTLEKTSVRAADGSTGLYLTNYIFIGKQSRVQVSQATHEFGEKLAAEAILKARRADTAIEALWQRLITALLQSDSGKACAALEDEERALYLTGENEIWSRAYDQFIAYGSGDPEHQRQISLRRSGSIGYESVSQWTEPEFAALRPLIHDLLIRVFP